MRPASLRSRSSRGAEKDTECFGEPQHQRNFLNLSPLSLRANSCARLVHLQHFSFQFSGVTRLTPNLNLKIETGSLFTAHRSLSSSSTFEPGSALVEKSDIAAKHELSIFNPDFRHIDLAVVGVHDRALVTISG